MTVVAVMVGLLAGLAGGWFVPQLIASVPEPEPDPDENPDDFPDKVHYSDVAASAGLAWKCAASGAVAGGLLGLALGWDWSLLWLLFLVPVGITLSVIDWTTWYLPSRILVPATLVTALLVAVASLATWDWRPIGYGALGWVVLGGYYGLLWFISPRIMAFGDVRLGALIGLALCPLSWGAVLLSAIAAGLLGSLALIPMRRAGLTIKRHAPFGPFLVVGALVAVVVAGFAA